MTSAKRDCPKEKWATDVNRQHKEEKMSTGNDAQSNHWDNTYENKVFFSIYQIGKIVKDG